MTNFLDWIFGKNRLFNLFGVDVFLHSTFIIFLFIACLSASISRGWEAGGILLLVLVFVYATVIVHEFGHILAARRCGVGCKYVVILPFGGAALLDSVPKDPAQELFISICGPATNVFFAALFSVLALYADHPANQVFVAMAELNAYMVLFNMLPAFPMDGGRIFRATLAFFVPHLTATKYASWLGCAMGIGMIGFGLWNFHFMIAVIGLLVFGGARAEYKGELEDEYPSERTKKRNLAWIGSIFSLRWKLLESRPPEVDLMVSRLDSLQSADDEYVQLSALICRQVSNHWGEISFSNSQSEAYGMFALAVADINQELLFAKDSSLADAIRINRQKIAKMIAS